MRGTTPSYKRTAAKPVAQASAAADLILNVVAIVLRVDLEALVLCLGSAQAGERGRSDELVWKKRG